MKAISKRAVFAYDELDHTVAEFKILRRLAIEDPYNNFVPRLHHAFHDRENFYLVMDFYPGGDLATQMEIHGTLGQVRTRFYATDIVEGLESLHRLGIVVRDLKPENVLLNARGHAVLADFGLSKDFGYRGDPVPIRIVAYPNHEALPPWAGAGSGSLRTMSDGRPRVVMDRAYSFVGTAEYLSPEVVQGCEYSYAVDWWALGCIIVEGLIGRVPFRKEDDMPLMALYDQILFDPWYNVLDLPPVRELDVENMGFDRETFDFVDGLLTKDPLRRLTQPFIKSHPYFGNIDWNTVRFGGYGDPHPLGLHPTDEYDTRYFPRLCLEETPTVDMTTHERRPMPPGHLSPLNDNGLYALAQAAARAELRNFEWSLCVGYDSDDDLQLGGVDLRKEPSDLSDGTQLSEPDAALEEIRTPESESADSTVPLVDIAQLVDTLGDRFRQAAVIDQAGSDDDKPSVTPKVPSPSVSIPATVTATPRPGVAELHDAIAAPPVSSAQASPPARPRPIPLVSRKTEPIGHFIPQEPDRERRLPSAAPAGGLSVSDVIAVQSSDSLSPNVIIRRQQQLGLVPSQHAVQARLSVEHHGTVTSLEDEGWEELDVGDDMMHLPSAPNGGGHGAPPSSFLTRGLGGVLMRRRPSALGLSGLRRQQRSSDSSRESSPTKLFSSRSIEHTRRALTTRLKAFPRRRVSASGDSASPSAAASAPPSMPVSASASASSIGTPDCRSTSPIRPLLGRKTTADRPSRAPSAANIAALFSRSRHGSRTKAAGGERAASTASPRPAPATPRTKKAASEASLCGASDAPPRLELTQTPPLEWDERMPDALGHRTAQ
ncbi:hypothetical protein Q5752_000696 [Cryptotrichosporon argae]